MPTPVLGTNIFEVVPTIQSSGLTGGDPLTVSQSGTIPSLLGGAGTPSAAPTYGTGSLYLDTTGLSLYYYDGAAWNGLSNGVSTVLGTTDQINSSTSTGTVTLSIAPNPVFPGTASSTIPTGTTAQRPATPTDGMIRYNTTEDILEGYSMPYNTTISPVVFQRTALYRKRRWWDDEFMSGTAAGNAVALYGELNWSITNSSGTPANTYVTGVADHCGILSLGTAAATGNNVRIHLGNVANTGLILGNQVGYYSFLIRVPTITTVIFRLGLFNDLTTTSNGASYTASAYFEYDSSINGSIRFATSNGGTTTTTTTLTTFVANTWYLFEAFYNGSSWTPVINGTSYTAISTNNPTTAVQPGAMVNNLAAAARTLQLDYFSMYTVELGNRY